MRKPTTTTRGLAPAPVTPAAQLSDEQRVALRIADTEGWRIVVQGGEHLVRLRHGHPARTVVLRLAGGDDDPGYYPAA